MNESDNYDYETIVVKWKNGERPKEPPTEILGGKVAMLASGHYIKKLEKKIKELEKEIERMMVGGA